MDVTQNLLALLVLGYLRRHCEGREKARTQGRIAGDLRALGIEAVSRTVRDATAALVAQGWPVGTSAGKPPGVFLCGTREDFLAARHNLTIRIRAQAARARRFEATAEATLSGQKTFDFDEADNLFHEIEAAPLLPAGGGDG